MKPIDLLYRWMAHPHRGEGRTPWRTPIQGMGGGEAGGQQVTLADLRINEQAIVLAFGNGRSETTRLASLGFTPGTEVDMTQNYGHGPLIVTIRGTRVALGRDEAAKILVERNKE